MLLNVKDKKILAELDLNARATFQEIAKKVHLSKETVIYRVRNLERRNIAQRYTTLVDFARLGYTGYAVYNRFEKVNEEKKREIISFLEKIPNLYWIALVGGKYDLSFALMCKSVFEFNKVYYQILTKYGDFLVDNTIAIRTELRQHKRKYLVPEKIRVVPPPYFGKEPKIDKLDELDENILSLMSNNARMSLIDIAATLKRPPSTVALRIKQLEKRGIIQGYSTYIKAQNYGMQSYRLFLYVQNMNEETRNRIFSYINSNHNMILGIETVGQWNFEITLEIESHEELQKEIAQLRNEFSDVIKNIEFIIMFEDDLIYDPYPLKKNERRAISIDKKQSKNINTTDV